jgi:hypothetical protein
VTVSGGQNRNEPLTGGPGYANIFSNFQTPLKLANSKRKLSHAPKNIQTLHGAIFEYFEQISQVGQLQILNRIHV